MQNELACSHRRGRKALILQLHFEAAGTGRPIVFSSGIGHTAASWSEIAAALTEKARVLSWDYRGHGRSDRFADPKHYSMDLAVADLVTMISNAGGSADKPAVLVGHSLGGYLSLRAAIENPQLVQALVLIATGPGFRDEIAREKWNRFVLSMDIGSEADSEARNLSLQSDGKVIDSLGSISVPTLVLVGSEDRRFLSAKDYLTTKIRGATGAVIDGARHPVHRTHARQVAAEILRFLSNHALLSTPPLERV